MRSYHRKSARTKPVKAALKSENIDHDVLLDLLAYSRDTGKFFRRPTMKKCGSKSSSRSNAHIQIYLIGKRFIAHRLAFFYVHKRWPKGNLKHIDGDHQNNAIGNLREL